MSRISRPEPAIASEIVATYGAAWNETDEAKRKALLEESWADDGVYQDPTGTADGSAALVTHIGEFHAMYPGRTIDFREWRRQ